MLSKNRLLLALGFSLLSLGVSALTLSAAGLPEFQPALPVRGPHSLVNLIDTQSLVKRGQGSATVMFNCVVGELGNAGGLEFYRGTPNSDMLGREVVRVAIGLSSSRRFSGIIMSQSWSRDAPRSS